DDWKAERTLLQKFDHAFFDRRYPLPRHHAADDLVLEDKSAAARQRPDRDNDVAELPMTAGLPAMTAALRGALADGFLVRHARRARVDLETKLTEQFVDGDLEMNLALSDQRHLVQLGVLFEVERWVFFAQLGDRSCQLDLVLAIGGLDG